MATNHQEIAECLARLGAAFGSAAKCLATASDSLSSAAQALAEAAQSISEMSRAMNPTSDISQAHTSLQEESVADGVLDISDSESEGEDGADRAGAVGASVSGVTWMNGHSAEASVSTDLTLCNNIFPSQVSTALHYYITLKEDFDVLPLIGHVANQNRKTVCFISHHKNLGPYQSILGAIVNGKVERPGKKQSSIDKAIAAFPSSASTVLLLKGDQQAPSTLGEISVDAVVHWGFPAEDHLISQMKLSKPTYTLLILPVDERSRVTNPILRKNGVIEHPEANQWTTIGPNSYLSSMRRKTITVLSTINPQRIKKIYEIQLARSGSPLEVARRANRFVARVLLHGDSSDGSTVFKPIGERPSAKAKLVKRKFEAAVGLGLVHVAQP